MEHPHAVAARDALAAFAQGDSGPAEALMVDDFVMVNHDLPEPWSRVEGRAMVVAFFWQFAELLEGTFAQDVVDVLATDEHLVLLVHETGRRGEAAFDNRAVYLVELRDGRWVRMETFDRDREANERFFAAVGAPGPALSGA